MGEHVVAEHQVRRAALGHEPSREGEPKEFRPRLDALFTRDLGDVRRRLNAQAGHAGTLEVLQEIPVIARDFDNTAARAEGELAEVTLRRLARVAEHRVGKRGEVEIFAEQLDGRDKVGDLQQPAVGADEHAERKARLWLAQVGGPQQVVRERLEAEVEHQFAALRAARAALEQFTHGVFAQASWCAVAAAVKHAICSWLKAIMSACATCRA